MVAQAHLYELNTVGGVLSSKANCPRFAGETHAYEQVAHQRHGVMMRSHKGIRVEVDQVLRRSSLDVRAGSETVGDVQGCGRLV
jgi:hypothetical protein